MRKAGLVIIFFIVVACAASSNDTHASAASHNGRTQTHAPARLKQNQHKAPRPGPTPARPPAQQVDEGKTPAQSAEQPKLTEAEEKLVSGSKASILAAGISEDYFAAHFKPFRIFNAAGDRRVVWSFSVNGHEAFLTDTVGFYTDDRGRRLDTHSVAGALGAAHDITRTITRRRAEQIMRACIGAFDGGAVIYRAAGLPERASLIFTAASIPRRARRDRREEREKEERERAEREAKLRKEKNKNLPQTDVMEEEDEGGGPPIFIGAVDLETGRCMKGRAISGPPGPERGPRERH
jgi:hypothetical protein